MATHTDNPTGGPTGARDTRNDAEVYTHQAPADTRRALFEVADATDAELREATTAARAAQEAWRRTHVTARRVVLSELAAAVERDRATLTELLIKHVGKPDAHARQELTYASALLRHIAERDDGPEWTEAAPGVRHRDAPVGVIAAITPFNNPVAVPLGKIGTALRWGNAVAWKPAPAATLIADRVAELLTESGCPAELIGVVRGGVDTAARLATSAHVDAVTVTGSIDAGRALAAICVGRGVPIQGELGGNNAAIVWHDADLSDTAQRVAAGAFGFAGQRCTANRRVIVDAACLDAFVELLADAARSLHWGDPADPATDVGPLITAARAQRVASAVDAARRAGCEVFTTHDAHDADPHGAYHPPTIVRCDELDTPIAQDETFGPVLVVQPADDFDHAMRLLNGVGHGLAASLFTHDARRRRRFLSDAQAGMLKLDRSTDGAHPAAPFAAWKASGIGPAEHGPCDRWFHTRTQTVYDAPE